jgi:hypothetical protein
LDIVQILDEVRGLRRRAGVEHLLLRLAVLIVARAAQQGRRRRCDITAPQLVLLHQAVKVLPLRVHIGLAVLLVHGGQHPDSD